MNKIICLIFIVSGFLFVNALGEESGSMNSSVIAVPKFDGDTTKGIYLIHLDNGSLSFIKNAKDSPDELHPVPLKINVFEALGRTAGDSAKPGEILVREMRKENGNVDTLLLADTVTGAMAYITDLGDDPDKGEVKQIGERPAQTIASSDHNYTMFMYYDPSGETNGTYLCHLTDGNCLYFNEIHKMHKKYAPESPGIASVIPNASSIIEVHSGNKGPRSHLVADNASGDLYWLEVETKKPKKLYCRKEHKIHLFDVFPSEAEVITPYRFVLVPILIDNDSTWHVLIVDVGSGKMAIFNVHDYKMLELRKGKKSINLYEYLPKETTHTRIITALPKILKGNTNGAWFFDSASGQTLFLNHIDDIHKIEITKVPGL